MSSILALNFDEYGRDDAEAHAEAAGREHRDGGLQGRLQEDRLEEERQIQKNSVENSAVEGSRQQGHGGRPVGDEAVRDHRLCRPPLVPSKSDKNQDSQYQREDGPPRTPGVERVSPAQRQRDGDGGGAEQEHAAPVQGPHLRGEAGLDGLQVEEEEGQGRGREG